MVVPYIGYSVLASLGYCCTFALQVSQHEANKFTTNKNNEDSLLKVYLEPTA